MLDATRAQEPGGRLPVMVKDKRVKTIDVHAHCLFHDAVNLMGDEARSVFVPVKGAENQYIVVAERLKQMDAMAIDMEVLSINPFWYRKDRDTAAAIVKVQNEKLAELCASQPERFAAFASLALQFPDLAVQQLDDAVKKLGLRGAQIGGSVAGEDFSNPRFHPVWAKAEELGAVLFIHPQSPPELAKRFQGNGWLSNTIGNPLDTTIALQHLIFEGTLDRFPGLKVLAAHGGGYPRLLRAALRPRLLRRAAGGLQSGHQAEEGADRVSETALLRCPGLYPRGAASPRGAGRRQPGHVGQRPPVRVGAASGGPRLRHHCPHRR
jgi:aminocarboxymuconate-semialdehyde decarboxylase